MLVSLCVLYILAVCKKLNVLQVTVVYTVHAKECASLLWTLWYIVHLCSWIVGAVPCVMWCCCWPTENTEEYKQLVEAKALVKRVLDRVNEAVRERENLRRTVDMNKRLDKRLLAATTDPILSEFKVCIIQWLCCILNVSLVYLCDRMVYSSQFELRTDGWKNKKLS